NRNIDRAAWRSDWDRILTADMAGGERVIGLSHLYLANALAGESGYVLSTSRPVAIVASRGRGWVTHSLYRSCDRFPETSALSPDWMALVFGHVIAGDWPAPGGKSGPCGSLYLPFADWALPRDDL